MRDERNGSRLRGVWVAAGDWVVGRDFAANLAAINDDFADAHGGTVAGHLERLQEFVVFQDNAAAVAVEVPVRSEYYDEQDKQPWTVGEPAAPTILRILLHRVLLQNSRRGMGESISAAVEVLEQSTLLYKRCGKRSTNWA